MIIQELEAEVLAHDSCHDDFERAEDLEEGATGWRTSFASTRRASRTCRAASITRTRTPSRTGSTSVEAEAERARIKRAIDRVRARLRRVDARASRHRAAHRPALPPLLGLAAQGGERAVELRRAGRGVRVPLHLARQQLPLLLAAAVLPQPARRDGARAGVTRTARHPQGAARGLRRRGDPRVRAQRGREHVFVRFTKTDLTTLDAGRAIARALGCDPRAAGFAGMKDRRAVTTQTISLQAPRGMPRRAARRAGAGAHARRHRGARRDAARAQDEGRAPRGQPLHHRGARRAPRPARRRRAGARPGGGRTGVPNAFGAQRFGRAGDNATRALAWLRGEERGPARSAHAATALVVAPVRGLQRRAGRPRGRRHLGHGARGGPVKTSFVRRSLPLRADVQTDRARAARAKCPPRGRMIGARMRWPEGAPAELERRIAAATLGEGFDLASTRRLGEGTRRPLRMWVQDLRWDMMEDDPGHRGCLHPGLLRATERGVRDDGAGSRLRCATPRRRGTARGRKRFGGFLSELADRTSQERDGRPRDGLDPRADAASQHHLAGHHAGAGVALLVAARRHRRADARLRPPAARRRHRRGAPAPRGVPQRRGGRGRGRAGRVRPRRRVGAGGHGGRERAAAHEAGEAPRLPRHAGQ